MSSCVPTRGGLPYLKQAQRERDGLKLEAVGPQRLAQQRRIQAARGGRNQHSPPGGGFHPERTVCHVHRYTSLASGPCHGDCEAASAARSAGLVVMSINSRGLSGEVSSTRRSPHRTRASGLLIAARRSVSLCVKPKQVATALTLVLSWRLRIFVEALAAITAPCGSCTKRSGFWVMITSRR